jgi:hypothetical protein
LIINNLYILQQKNRKKKGEFGPRDARPGQEKPYSSESANRVLTYYAPMRFLVKFLFINRKNHYYIRRSIRPIARYMIEIYFCA